MEIPKTLDSIALDITEPQYRAMPELSYSTLSTYEKLGYDGLEHLFDKKESPSLTLGSMVDAILTGGKDEFDERFLVFDGDITDGGKDVCNKLAEMQLPFDSFEEIPESIVSQAAKEAEFWKADKWDKKRYGEVLKTGDVAKYYHTLTHSDKVIVDSASFQKALECVKALRESPATHHYFAENDELSPVRRYYQLKFKAVLGKEQGFANVGYRCMMDLVVVNYEKKTIYPIDLKTSGKQEWHFEDSFMQWQYMHQARLYYRILKANLAKDSYFKDFEVKNYRFVVVNSRTLTPLVWEFPLTDYYGTLISDNGDEYRDPYEIGVELREYLDCKPPVPKGIDNKGINIINCLHMKK